MKQKKIIPIFIFALLAVSSLFCAFTGISKFIQWRTLDANLFMPSGFRPINTTELLPEAFQWMSAAWACMCLCTFPCILQVFHGQKSQKEMVPSIAADLYQQLQIHINDNTIVYKNLQFHSRRQIVVLLQYLLRDETHRISYPALNQLLGEHFYDNSPQSRRKISNLKYEMNQTLKDTPFILTNPSADELFLNTK